MNRLPPEIIHMICISLTPKDVTNFRLCCRCFATIGAYHMIPEVTFYVCGAELERLESIAYHPIFGKQVRALHYESDILPSRMRTYEEFLDQARRVKIVRAILPGRLNYPERPLYKVHTPAELKAYYEKYKYTLKLQKTILSSDGDSAVMTHAMESLPKLDEITMSAGGWRASSSKREDPFKKLCLQTSEPRPHSLPEPEGVQQLLNIIAATEDSNTNLKILRAGKLSWQFFPCFGAVQALDPKRLCGVLKDLTRLELHIGIGSRMTSGVDVDEQVLDALHSQQGLKTSSMRRFLVELPKLRALNITFDVDMAWRNPASLSTIFSVDSPWLHLEELTLGQIKCTHEELLAILVSHKFTLKYLSLRYMALESSWPLFLRDVQKNLNLEDACICGTLIAYTMFPSDEEIWNIPTPEMKESCRFREDITRFLVSGGDCPLNVANAMDAIIYG